MHGSTMFDLMNLFRRFTGSVRIIRVTLWRRWGYPRLRYIRDCGLYDVEGETY
jgi:hypothetical protein